MLYSYNECLNKYGSDRKIKEALQTKKIFKLEKGIYSTKPKVPELLIISTKYSNAIFTLNSAFYYYGLTDTIPDQYFLATSKHISKIRDNSVKQKYENSMELDLGVDTLR